MYYMLADVCYVRGRRKKKEEKEEVGKKVIGNMKLKFNKRKKKMIRRKKRL